MLFTDLEPEDSAKNRQNDPDSAKKEPDSEKLRLGKTIRPGK
jgi:hypothetical protein